MHTSQGLVEAASLQCHAQRTALPDAATRGGLHCARCHAHASRRTHAATFRCTPIPRARGPAPTLNAGLRCAPDAPIAAVGFPPSLADPQTVPAGPLAGLCQFWISFSVWQAEEAVANLPLRVAVRGRTAGHQACAQHDGAHTFG